MQLELIALDGPKLNTRVYQTTLPTPDGQISIYPDHEALVTIAQPGVIVVRYSKEDDDDQLDYLAIGGGVVEVSGKRIRILVDEAEHSDEILEDESRAALERAIEMRDSASDQIELDKAHQLIDRHQVRLKVAELKRRKRRR